MSGSTRDNLVAWVAAMRPFSFTVSLLPPLVAGALAWGQGHSLHPVQLLVTLAGCVLAHAAANMLGDWGDWRQGLDRPGHCGPDKVLITGRLRPGQVLVGGLVALGLAALAGLWLAVVTPAGWRLLGLAGLGGLCAVAYALGPLSLKDLALGDVAVFLCFGPLMAVGAYCVQTGRLAWSPVVAVLPLGLLVVAILHANNLRDLANDRACGVRTVATLLGSHKAGIYYHGLVLGAYLLTVLAVGVGQLAPTALAVFLSLPLAHRRIVQVRDAAGDRELLLTADVGTAQLHLLFGLLLLLGLLVAK